MFKRNQPQSKLSAFFLKPKPKKKTHTKKFIGLGVFSATCFAVARALENRNP